MLVDLESTRGTTVDRTPLRPNEPTLVKPESWARVELGNCTLRERKVQQEEVDPSLKTRPLSQNEKRQTNFRAKMAVGSEYYKGLSAPATESFIRAALGTEQQDSAAPLPAPVRASLGRDEQPTMVLSDDQSRAYMIKGEIGRGGQGVVYMA